MNIKSLKEIIFKSDNIISILKYSKSKAFITECKNVLELVNREYLIFGRLYVIDIHR